MGGKWYTCLHEQRAYARAWFRELLLVAVEPPLDESHASPLQSNHNKTCVDPSNMSDIENMNCNCVEDLHKSCAGEIDRHQCVLERSCSSTLICDNWKLLHCNSTTTDTTAALLQRGSGNDIDVLVQRRDVLPKVVSLENA